MPNELRINMCEQCSQPFSALYPSDNVCSDCTSNNLAQSFHREGQPDMAAMFAARPETNDPNWQETLERGNPMDMAWRLLKNMGDDDPAFAAHREEMERLKQQEEQIRQQAQATAPKMTPQIQSYQQQLDAQRAKEEQERNILNLKREGKPRIKDYRQAVLEYYNTHGHYPRRTKKAVMRVVERMRERGD